MSQKNIKKQLENIYKIMLKEYGAQGWWPLTPYGKLASEYHPNDYSYPNRSIILMIILIQK